MQHYPKILSVKSLPNFQLFVVFQDQTKKVYDCSHLLSQEPFKPLTEAALFNTVKVDQGGYGISWNDDIDIAESELWINGAIAEPVN